MILTTATVQDVKTCYRLFWECKLWLFFSVNLESIHVRFVINSSLNNVIIHVCVRLGECAELCLVLRSLKNKNVEDNGTVRNSQKICANFVQNQDNA